MSINLLQLLKTCKTTSSLNEKKELIKQWFYDNNNPIEEELFRFYLDPCYATNFDKKSSAKKGTREDWMKPFIENETLFDIVDMFHTREVTGNEACGFYTCCKDNLDKEDMELLSIILFKEPMGITYKVVNDVHVELHGKDFINVYQVQLANTYSENKNYKNVTYWYGSRKLDGMRCYYKKDSLSLMSRNNKPIVGFEFIISQLQLICDQFDIDFVDGELYLHGLNFQKTVGIINSDKNINETEKDSIKYNIFAVLPSKDKITNTNDMISTLANVNEHISDRIRYKHIEIVKYERITNNKQDIETKCIEYVKEGYEGIMLRHPSITYDFKRSDALLKFKMFKEMCLRIVGFEEGTGKNEGTLGALVLTNKDGSINCKCGSGFDEEERDAIWNNKDEWYNQIVEIKYQDITDDGSSLRFPIYRGIRHDVDVD